MTSVNINDVSTLWKVQGPGLAITKAGEQTTVAILPPEEILHRLDASCFMVTVTNDVGYLYELNVRSQRRWGIRLQIHAAYCRKISSESVGEA